MYFRYRRHFIGIKVKWGAFFWWSFRPISTWGSIETTTIRETHPTVLRLAAYLNIFSRLCNVLTSTGWYFDSGTFSNWAQFLIGYQSSWAPSSVYLKSLKVSRDEATRVLSDKSVGSFLVRRTEPNRKQHVNVSTQNIIL